MALGRRLKLAQTNICLTSGLTSVPLLVTNILQVLLCCAQGHALDGLKETRAELHMELKGTSHCQTATSGQLNLLKIALASCILRASHGFRPLVATLPLPSLGLCRLIGILVVPQPKELQPPT